MKRDPAGAAGRQRGRRRRASRTAPTPLPRASRRGSRGLRQPPTPGAEPSSARVRERPPSRPRSAILWFDPSEERSVMVQEAQLEKSPAGLGPASEGWFVVNVRDAEWVTTDDFGAGCRFESPEAPFTG